MAHATATTVLVVDDDPEILNVLQLRLSNRGYRVITAVDGNAALEVARRELPAIILLDVMMPAKSGWEVVKALKHDPATADIKVVMVSAIGHAMNEMTSDLYGADAHVDKPFQFDKLEATIKSLLG